MLRALIIGLIAVAAMTPAADLLAFGIHEHVTASAPEHMAGSGAPATDSSPHHCEFWMSPGELTGMNSVLDGPMAVEVAPPEQARTALSRSPVVPRTPPRS